MAIYHFSANMISRAAGSSALAAAAYRSASRLHDKRLDRHHDFSNKAGVVHSEVMLPDGAPDEWADREKLWNAVEAAELRKDAQLAREIEFAIPREMTQAEGIELAREFVKAEFVDRGMVADLNVHWDIGADGLAKPHAHVMLATRSVEEEGFGSKVRDWNRTDLLERWRERWAEHANARLAELDIDARLDHRSLEAQGIELEPQHKIGPAASRMAGQGLESERLAEHHAIARENGERILAKPIIALDAITHQQATFTTRDLAMFVHRHSEGKDQFDQVLAAVKASPEIVKLGRDGRGEDRFTSRAMIEAEQRLAQATTRLDATRTHTVSDRDRDRALARAAGRKMILSPEQRGALEQVTDVKGLGVVVGYAGTGKSAVLGVAREAWENAGYTVRGAALSGIAAENLENGSGISSRTIASLEHQWGQGRELLGSNDVLVIDEAGMIGTRQMERVISEAEKRGAKIVLVGDPEQLQAIEGGAAFRSIAERHGGVEITAIRRQRDVWQRDATRQLATGRTGEAIAAYENRGLVHSAGTRADVRTNLIDRWDRDRRASPEASRLILTHTNDEVRALNVLARERLHSVSALGPDVEIATARGARSFATGDRVMFLKNERALGVKNGSLGTIERVGIARMAVLLDDGRAVAFDLKDYQDVDHGYAATIHKSQGVTVDQVHVLATPGLDRHSAYVALSRHRDTVDVHYGHDDFADQGKLVRTLSRERGKDMASDYGIAAGPAQTPQRSHDRFAVPKLDPSPAISLQRGPLDKAVERYARAAADIIKLRGLGYEALPHQRVALQAAAAELNGIQSHAARDLLRAINADPALVDEASRGRTQTAIRAMTLEGEIRTNLDQRAEKFVADWQQQARRYRDHAGRGEEDAASRIRQGMVGMAKSLERDPQLESLLRNRVKDLGIRASGGASVSHELQEWLGISRGRGIGR
jgi:Ti-type conjugative transfer relaxase TraA